MTKEAQGKRFIEDPSHNKSSKRWAAMVVTVLIVAMVSVSFTIALFMKIPSEDFIIRLIDGSWWALVALYGWVLGERASIFRNKE